MGDPSLVLNCPTEVTGENRDCTFLGHAQKAIDQLFDHDNSYLRRTLPGGLVRRLPERAALSSTPERCCGLR